ncbi:CPBP family intramembrane glutamic endopeptidase [Actinoplanes sp. NPDC026670]|uniref:CPBP family intramembrane glutamic endopeptidase n=1 Tax=Actinoplanes sp. NPDC026670 TaxID=3154700 RepID=UPI0033CA7C6F
MTGRARLNFIIFALTVAGTGWLGVAVDRAAGVETATGTATSSGSGTTGMLFFLLGPLVAVPVLRFLSRDGGGSLGLSPRAGLGWFAFAAVFYPLVTAISIGLGVATGYVTVTDRTGLFGAAAAVFAVQLIKNPIEELVFRGYGTRTALAMGLRGRLVPHLLAGAVWGLWHVPLYLVWTSAADMALVTTLPMPLFLLLTMAGTMAASVLYGEMRARTGSIWPGVLMHSFCNALATPLMVGGYLTFEGHSDAVFSPVAGSVVLIVLTAAAGCALVFAKGPATVRPPAPLEQVS